jgi:hypothetical protein
LLSATQCHAANYAAGDKTQQVGKTEQKIDQRKDPFMALPVDLQAAPAPVPQAAMQPPRRRAA